MSVNEKLEEIMDDLKGRIRNPLILSFILVWLYFHWSLLYKILTFNNAIPVESRLSLLTKYVSDNGKWCGMIGKPLLWSFISLAFYYIIAIAAQAIKIYLGKRLNAQMLARVDTGSWAFKTELSDEKKNLKRVWKELDETRLSLNNLSIENTSLEDRIIELEKDLSGKNRDLDLIRKNIKYNENFQENFEKTLLFLLAEHAQINQEHIRKPEFHTNYYRILNGSWSIHKNPMFSRNTGNTTNLKILNEKVMQLTDEIYGEISEFKFDKQYHILNFTIHTNKDASRINQKWEKYNLIQITIDEFIGFCDSHFCHLKRHD